ncbi:MAG: DUF4426 domain-containing protein [Thioalkalivibrionaceae bacterium]
MTEAYATTRPTQQRRSVTTLAGILLAGLASWGTAQAAETEFDRYIVHHNVINTTFLSPDVARAYEIRRSSSRALVNVTVMEKAEGGLRAVPATVNGRATNRNQQMKFIGFRSVTDGDAVYQLGEVPVRGGEELNFEIDVRPQTSSETLTVEFSQRFYGD